MRFHGDQVVFVAGVIQRALPCETDPVTPRRVCVRTLKHMGVRTHTHIDSHM